MVDIQEENDEVLQTPLDVTVTLRDRSFGGHEEGGWWYDTEEVIEHHYCPNLSVLSKVMNRVNRYYDNQGRRPISSVLSSGLFRVYIGQGIPRNYPGYRPHYE